MITRTQYLDNSKELHNAYYEQFVTDEIQGMVVHTFGLDNIVKAYEQDNWLNNISLNRWDALAYHMPSYVNAGLKNVGDYGTLAGHVCILKAAARIVVNRYNAGL